MTDQLALIDGESDEALFLPREQAQKRYTAATVEKIDLKRNYILDLIGFGLPMDIIAERTRSSTRTVKLLGAKYAQEAAVNSMRYAQVLKNASAEFLFLAKQKAPEAKFGELMVGVGIAAQRAQEMELTAGHTGDLDNAINVETENPALLAARAFLESRRPRQLEASK